MFVFGRNTTADHGRLGDIANELTRRPEESWQAVGWNVLYDHRVSERRAADFYAREKPATDRQLEQAIRNYYWDVVCKAPEQSYLSSALNGHNFVAKNSLSPNLGFAHVLNLTAWAKVIYWESRLDSFIRSRQTLADDQDFLTRFLTAVNAAWDRRPIWLARWSEFEKLIEPGRPSTWNSAIGVWRQTGEWQVVLRIALSEVTALARPTQLDAGFYQYHFPSPPLPVPHEGGIGMELQEVRGRRRLVAEWIHSPVELKIDHWIDGGRRLDVVNESAEVIMVYRSQHRERLALRHPGDWIPPK